MDGNAEQVRAVATQLADAFAQNQMPASDQLRHLEERIDAKIDAKVDAAVVKMKFWVISAVMTQVVAMLPIIFFLGGIYNTNNTALEMLRKQQGLLEKRGEWMNQRDRWEQSIEQWAEPKGYQPPRYRESAR